MGWPEFPPLPTGTSDDDTYEYLFRCDVEQVVINAASQVSVALLDPDHQRWIFNYGRAGLEVERYSDVHGNSGPQHGINEMYSETVDAFPHEVHQDNLTVYTVRGPVGLFIEGRSVELIPPHR